MLNSDYDILIVGAGLNGASLAYALALYGRGLRIGLIETRELSVSPCIETDYDARSIALAYGSQLIYQHLGLWESIQAHVTPINEVHVSERGRFGSLSFNKMDLDVAALGYVLPAVTLQKILNNALDTLSKKDKLDLICPAQVTEISRSIEAMTVEYVTGENAKYQVRAKLVIGADGADSAVRRLSHIPVMIEDYEQMAIVTPIHLARSHCGVAYERFTAEGILAMLPLLASPETTHRCTLIWTVGKNQAEGLLNLSDSDFLSRVQQLFGYRLGRLQALGKRNAVPLRKVSTLDAVQSRLVLVGNAAHSLHPVAAQGLNLGLRDIAILLEVILGAYEAERDIGSLEILKSYAEGRGADQEQIMGFVDGLIKLFGKQSGLFSRLRGFALQLLDINPVGKYYLARLPMGVGGRVSKLASGIPL